MTGRAKDKESYSLVEIQEMKSEWLKKRNEISRDPLFAYYFDRDQELQKFLNNANLKAMFRHASHLYHKIQQGEEIHLYPREQAMIVKPYREIMENGYYDRSKAEEKRIRAWLGKIVSRQTYRRYKKR